MNEKIEEIRNLVVAWESGDLALGDDLAATVLLHYGEESALGKYVSDAFPAYSSRKRLFLQTCTYWWLGTLVLHGPHGLVLADCAWVRDSGEDLAGAITSGKFADVQAFGAPMTINSAAIMNLVQVPQL